MSLYFPDSNEISDVQAGDAYRQQLQQMQGVLQQQGVTPERMMEYYRLQPNASPGLLGGALASGMDPSQYGALAEQDPGRDEFRWYDPTDWITEGFERGTGVLNWAGSFIYEQVLKPLVRGAFALTEGISQEAIQRPISALMAGAQTDLSVREAYNQYGTSAVFQALGNVIGEDTPEEQALQGTGLFGTGFDLGQGFFAGGAGQEQADADRELMVRGQQANMGRLFLDPFFEPIGLDPGDRIYDTATGITQFVFDVLLDPSILVTAGTGGVAKAAGRGAGAVARVGGRGADDAARIADSITKALTIEGTSQRARAARSFTEVVEGGQRGVVSRLPEGVEGTRVRETLNSPRNRLLEAVGLDPQAPVSPEKIRAAIASNLDNEEVVAAVNDAVGIINGPNGRSVMFDKIQSFLQNDGVIDALVAADEATLMDSIRAGRETSLPNDFIAAIGKANTREEVSALLTEAITKGHIENRNFYGGFGNRVGNALRNAPVIGEKVEKFSGIAARGFLDAMDKDVALGKLDTIARQGGLSREDRNWIVQRIGQMERGNQSEMFEIATEVYSRVGSRILADDPERGARFIKGLTDAYKQELEGFRQFFVNDLGEAGAAALPTRTIKKQLPDGSSVEVVVPQPHLLTEFNKMMVPVPDIDDIRRAATKSDMARKVYESAGWGKANRSLRFITRGLFKPLVLLRPAYIARTQLDDQLRMWAAGVDGVFSNPRHLIQMASKAPETLADLASKDPSVALYARKILNQSILDVDGDSIAKPLRQRIWTTVQKPMATDAANPALVKEEFADYIKAWRHELGQLADDQIASFLVRNDLDVETAVRAILGGRVMDPAQRALVERQQEIYRHLDGVFGTHSMDDFAKKGSPLRELTQRAQKKFERHRFEQDMRDAVNTRLQFIEQSAEAMGMAADEILVDPLTGSLVRADYDPSLDGFADDMPPPEFGDLDEQGSLGTLPPDSEDLLTLDEYADHLESKFWGEWEMDGTLDGADVGRHYDAEFREMDRFTFTNRVKWMVQTALEDAGFDEAEEFAGQFYREWLHWTDSKGDSFLHQNTLREGGVLHDFVRASSKAGFDVVYRGQAMPKGLFEDLLAKGVLSEGEMWRFSRISSATTDLDQTPTFMSLGSSSVLSEGGEPVRMLIRMDGEVRAANMSWATNESELLLPDQPMRIRKIEKLEVTDGRHAAYTDPLTGEELSIYTGNGDDVYVIDLEGVTDGSVTQKVMEEGAQPFMFDMNRGAYDGTPQSLAGSVWDDLSPSERDEYETVHSQIQKWLTAARDSKDVAFIQYHSELRHLVDNAPPVQEHIYVPQSAVTIGEVDTIRGSTAGEPVLWPDDPADAGIEVGDVLRTDQNRPYLHSEDMEYMEHRAKHTRERMSKGVIDPSMVDEDTVIRLPKGAQALRVTKDGTYIVPPSQVRVVAITERGGKKIIDVEIETQAGKAVQHTPRDVNGPLHQYISRVAQRSNAGALRLLEDEDYLRQYLQSVVDRIQIKTGGNQRLIDILRREPTSTEDIEDWVDLLDNDGAFESVLAEHVVDDAPAYLKAQRFPGDEAAEDRGILDTIVAMGYEHIVSKPAGYLSRFPAWVEFMTRDGADLMAQMYDDGVRAAFLDIMEETGATATQMARLRKAADAAKGKQGVIGSAEEARELALMHSTESVENLLFDVTNKSAFQDAFDVIFPFVDAWREGLSVWSRLIKQDPSIFLKGLAGMRSAEETGMIYTNERGERMFSMPFSGTLGNFTERLNEGQGLTRSTFGALGDTIRGEFDDDAIDPIQSQFDFNLSGVNLMFNSIGPGFGPVIQWPAGAFIPDTPEFVGLRELINPYGTPYESPADLANPLAAAEALAPAWAKKVINAWGGGNLDPIQWNAAVHDALRALEMSGRYDPTSLDDRARLTDDAERSARWMLFMRGVVHGFAVTGPQGSWAVKTDGVDEDFEPFADWDLDADPDGVWHQINSLASSYYEMYDSLGDHGLAQQKFIEAYGVTPAYLRTPKSRALTDLPATKEAAFWAEDHRDAMAKFPLVAGLFAPPDEGGEGFDYQIYQQQFESGQRTFISPEDQIALANRTQAQQIYYNTKDRVDALDITANQKRSILATVKAQLNEQFPGWEIGIAGVTNVPTDQKIEQLEMAAFDESLADAPLTAPLRAYFAARNQLLTALRAESGSEVASFARQDAEQYRVALTQIGATLASQSAEFRGAWELLRREVD